MTNRTQMVKRCSLVALVAAASVPALIACGGGSSNSSGAAAPSASYAAGYGQPPPGYGGYPQQPGAYPQQQPGAYPQQQPGAYPQQQPGAYPQQQPGAYPQQPGAQPGAQPGQQPAPLGSVVTTDPNQLAQLFQQAAQAGQAILQNPGAVTGDPVDACLAAAAAKHAQGMQPEGQVAKGQLQEGGQHLDFMITMQPGKCYTVIGCGPTVKNLDLVVLTPPFYNAIAGQDTTDNSTPVVGSTPHPMCPVIPLPLTYKVDLAARSGSGNVGAQVYSKAAK